MSAYKKLQQARVMLQKIKMSKSGHNKFAGYSYFELGDFLPHINEIFNEVGLCGLVSFTDKVAELWIHETDGDGKVLFSSPMAEVSLKGCHPIQNLGAVQSYLRRYLWVSALEIVEHDAIDAQPPEQPPKKEPAKKEEKKQPESDGVDYSERLNNADDLQQLVQAWQTIPKSQQFRFIQLKDSLKAKFMEKSI